MRFIRDRRARFEFLKERTLQDFVARYYGRIFEGKEGLADARLVKAQYPVNIADKKKIIDLYFKGADGASIVVELKRGDPHQGALFQLRQYMDVVRPKAGHVRGVLISARPQDPALAKALWSDLDSDRRDHDITWLWYDLSIDLIPATRESS